MKLDVQITQGGHSARRAVGGRFRLREPTPIQIFDGAGLLACLDENLKIRNSRWLAPLPSWGPLSLAIAVHVPCRWNDDGGGSDETRRGH